MTLSTLAGASGAMGGMAPVKPRLRGVSHQYGFFVSLALAVTLVASATSTRSAEAGAVFGFSVAALLGTSALYHRHDWSPSRRRWMRRLDHSMIFVLIAGSYTPVALLALSGTLADVVLAVVWGGALAGIVLKLVWIDAPKPVIAGVYVALGWVAAATTGQLLSNIGVLAVVGLGVGGLLYSVGAVVYALGRPNPVPGVFGYHEVFHALVLGAAAIHYAVIAFAVLPRG
jgi:hemolysin III